MAEYGSLPFQEQIDFFRQKLNLPTARWDDLLGAAHDRAFVVAGAMQADLLADLRVAVTKGIEQGTTLEAFRADFNAIVAKHGWHGWTGEGTPAGEAWRTNVIYATNLRTSHAAGRYAQLQEIKHARPYWRYVHNDTVLHPRPHHQALDGLVLPADDKFWDKAFPPAGFGCRCRVESLAQRDLERDNLTVGEAPKDWQADKGWNYAPGASVSDELRKLINDKQAKLPGQIGKDFADAMNVLGSPPMRSEELAALAGDINPADLGPIHNRARDEVIRKGKETGKEHGAAVLAEGSIVEFGGDFENSLKVPEFNASDRSVTVHHNHPAGDSLSRPDLRLLLGRSDLARVDAHGPLGGWSSAERIGDVLPPHLAEILIQDASSQAKMLTMKAAKRGSISQEATQAGLWLVVMALLLEKQGVIRYALNSESVLAMARKVIENER
jgi:SPP1 gp7 family putative phage head morphogenesis protein